MEGSCLTCAAIHSCMYLADSKTELVPERLIMPENVDRACEGWTPIGPRELRSRARQYELSGMGCLRALFILPSQPADTMRLRETEELEHQMREDTPNFAGMLRPGVTTVSQREEQLLYETNEAGEVLYEDSPDGPVRRPRPSYQVRNFACDPESHIGTDQKVVFWLPDKVVKHILKEELKQGLIVKDGSPTATQPKTAMMAAPTKETIPMATSGNKVIVNRGTKTAVGPKGAPIASKGAVPAKAATGAGAAAAGKVASPPKKGAVMGKSAPAAGPVASDHVASDPGPTARGGPSASRAELEEIIGTAVSQIVTREVLAAKNEILAAVVATNKSLQEDLAGRVYQNLQAMTAWHDMMVKSGGGMTHIPVFDEKGNVLFDEGTGEQLFSELPDNLSDHPNLLLAYVLPDEEEQGE